MVLVLGNAVTTRMSQEESPLLGHKYAAPEEGDEEVASYQGIAHSSNESTLSHSFSDTSSDCEGKVVSVKVVSLLDLSSQHEGKEEKKHQSLWDRVDKGAWQFGLRMAVLLSLSSLFVLIRTDDHHFPDGMWVLVSVLFVCWFPALDAASVIEKIVQRLIGTFVGAFLGLSCGFVSISFFSSRSSQAVFLEVCTFVFIFLIVYVAGQAKVGAVKVIKKFGYATILCVLTFCICMLPFATDKDPKWYTGVSRVVNVIVGCLLGAVGSIVVCPKSTADVLHSKAEKQVKMAGDAAEAVLQTASDFFAGRIYVNRLADDILETPLESAIEWKFMRANSLKSDCSEDTTARADIALKKYEEAIADWGSSKMLFPLANYDPFHVVVNKEEARAVQLEIARTLARALRIQTTIVVLDGMVRNDANYDFLPSQLHLFAETGTLIKQMLTVPLRIDRSDDAANRLFLALEEIRKWIQTMSTAVAGDEDEFEELRFQGIQQFRKGLLETPPDLLSSMRTMGDENGRGIPSDVTGRHDNTLFFLQLVEHLILRSLRLYQAWKHVPKRAN
jgi:Aluminium activated malate transporter